VKYRIFYTNFGYWSQDEHTSLDAAKTAAVKAGFESTINLGDEIIFAWSPIGGFRKIY